MTNEEVTVNKVAINVDTHQSGALPPEWESLVQQAADVIQRGGQVRLAAGRAIYKNAFTAAVAAELRARGFSDQ